MEESIYDEAANSLEVQKLLISYHVLRCDEDRLPYHEGCNPYPSGAVLGLETTFDLQALQVAFVFLRCHPESVLEY